MPDVRHRLAALTCGLALAGPALLVGCAPSSPLGDPTGIDQLVVPTPSPEAADFVAVVDNRWLPLAPGTSATFRVSSAEGTATRTVRVREGTVDVAGVATTAVTSVTGRGAGRQERTDYVAQDRAGNVWWFGREGRWRAGEEGAEAGLLMAAAPRLGDGYRPARVPGEETVVTTVVQVDGAVVLEHVTGGDGASTVTETYREGVGLVERVDAGSGVRETRQETR